MDSKDQDPDTVIRKEAVDTAATDNADHSKEEKARQDASLRAEREATFGDYIVSLFRSVQLPSQSALTRH